MQLFVPAAILIGIGVAPALGQTIEVANHQPFDIHMPWIVRQFKAPDGKKAQQVAGDATVIVDIPANGTARPLDQSPIATNPIGISATDEGVDIALANRPLGTLAWDIVFQKLDKKPSDKDAAKKNRDFAGTFHPLTMRFRQTASGSLFDTWSGEAHRDGLKLAVVIDGYHDSFIDVHCTLGNETAPTKSVYAAVVTRWRQPRANSRSVDYDNHISKFADGGATPFRAGADRHVFIQRGVDWINSRLDGASAAWLFDFSPSFTVHRAGDANHPARWIGANSPQLGQEAVLHDDAIYSITEIARPNLKMYAARMDTNVLPPPGEPINFDSRIVLNSQPISNAQADQNFIAYTGYAHQSRDDDTTRIDIGAKYTKFGTAYFPYSTLGENFEKWHMPGMSGDTYWPLAAETVKHYPLFADEIRRDLRIAKAMGFRTIRLHHLELIASLDLKTQNDYLDFLFGEMKHLGLKALIDVNLPPPRVAEIVTRYRAQIDGVELDNEVLIFGIPDDEIDWFKQTYAAVKAIAPQIPVHLTASTNTGAFERLIQLGVPFDRLGAHAYMDSLDAIPSARDYALAVADEARKLNKEPVITEWNWRFLTRMTPQNRAKIYPPIFENVLKTRCMPELQQFQFQESLAMAPHTLRGIRHYELLNLSRHPRPEAMELMKLIHQYDDPAAPQQTLRTAFQSIELAPKQNSIDVDVKLTNRSARALHIVASPEGPGDVTLSITSPKAFTLAPGGVAHTKLNIQFPASSPPGFYHCFVQFDGGNSLISYAWIEVQKPGRPVIDGLLDFDLNRPIAVVYGQDAPGWELESAWYIAETLESASGRIVPIYQLNDLPPSLRKRGNLIVVGNRQSNALIASAGDLPAGALVHLPAGASHGDWLIVTGKSTQNINTAAMDFVLRYWKHAKDSGARRIALTDAPIVKGADPSALP